MPLFGRKKNSQPKVSDEHALITYLPLSGDEFGTVDEREAVFALESRIEEAVARLGGEHPGNEFGEGYAILYTYGPDADALLAAVRASFRGLSGPGGRLRSQTIRSR